MAAADVSPALLAVRRAVLDGLQDLDPGDLVLVACSGGADSIALAAGAAISGRPAGAVIVDHGLQDDSAVVARDAADQCKQLGLDPVIVTRVQVGRDGGPEAAAREARHSALRAAAEQSGASAVLLAHTLDDQAETVLLRLARGSGARSLAAMAPRDGLIRRPLLSMRREQVRAAAAHLSTHEDPHNADGRFARSRLRAHGLPALVDDLGDGVVPALARTADSLREDNEALDQWAAGVPFDAGPATVAAEIGALAGLPKAVRLRVLRAMALAAGSPGGSLNREHLLAVESLVSAWRGQGPLDLPGSVRAARESGRLVLQRPPGSDSADR